MTLTTRPARHPRARREPVGLAALAEATPADRDRYLDLLRAISIAVVALGHWLLAVVRVGPDGTLVGSNALSEVPSLHLLTWAFQVMPLFFLVGGYANARSWAAARRDGTGYAAWMSGRLRRLARPTTVFVGVWSVAAVVLRLAGVPGADVRLGAGLVAVPLWFVAVYALLVALAPAMSALHRRAGWWVPVGLTAAVAAVDLAHLHGVPVVGWANFVFVWLLPQQLGFLWAEGRLERGRRVALATAAAGLLLLVLLTTVGGYPVSMVGVPGAARSNNSPPTLALIALTVWQLGAALLLAPSARRWLQRRRVWMAVIAANARAMTLFLWHLSALVVVSVTVVPQGWLGDPAPGTAAWWSSRPLWLALLAAVLVPFVVVFGRCEQPGGDRPPLTARATLVATVGLAGGCAFLATGGLDVVAAPLGLPLAGVLGLTVAAATLRGPSTAPAPPR